MNQKQRARNRLNAVALFACAQAKKHACEALLFPEIFNPLTNLQRFHHMKMWQRKSVACRVVSAE